MKTSLLPLVLICALIAAVSCKKKTDDPPATFTKSGLHGYSQKGPFVNGSTLTIYELDAAYAQTGNSFNTQIKDNLGTFELPNISLLTSFAKLKADGYYFNEIKNTNSAAPITLYAFSDLADKSSVNINLLTTLEVSRMEYLIGQGSGFSVAKKQAQQEILNIFSIHKPDLAESELLDIAQNGDDNAILLAISLILQGYRTEAELTQLLGDIATDIRTDGVLNSASTGTALINHAKLFNLPGIRSNIENRYQALGVSVTIPNFEHYIHVFIDSTQYLFTNNILYPFMVSTRENILKDTTTTLGNSNYAVAAWLPIGTALKVVVKPTPGFNAQGYGWEVMSNSGWTYNNSYPDSCVLTATGSGQLVDIPFIFGPPSSLDFIIYENNSATPTRIKTIAY